MTRRSEDLVGRKFGRLTVLRRGPKSPSGATQWLCRCTCLTETLVTSYRLASGEKQSCGCLRKELATELLASGVRELGQRSRVVHGGYNSRLYSIWTNMIQRCTNPNHVDFHNYGGRGIAVCKEWRENFVTFRQDMGEPPSHRHSLDRNDTNGDYSRHNCRWALPVIQSNNTRTNVFLTFRGVTQTVAQWAKQLNLPHQTIRRRIKAGWATEDILRRAA